MWRQVSGCTRQPLPLYYRNEPEEDHMTPAAFKTARRKAGLTQGELGAKLGIKARQVRNIETGVSPIRAAYSIALRALCEASASGHQEETDNT